MTINQVQTHYGFVAGPETLVGETWVLTALQSPIELHRRVSAVTGNVEGYIVPPNQVPTAGLNKYRVRGLENVDGATVLFFESQGPGDHASRAHYILAQLPASHSTSMWRTLDAACPGINVQTAPGLEYDPTENPADLGAHGIIVKNYTVFYGDDDVEPYILHMSGLEPIEKILSLAYKLFPWCRTKIEERYAVQRLNDTTAATCAAYGITGTIAALPPTFTHRPEDLIACYSIPLLNPFYGDAQNSKNQMHKRLVSLCNEATLTAPSVASIAELMTSMNLLTKMQHPTAGWVIGLIVAVKIDSTIDVRGKRGEFESVTNLTAEYKLPIFEGAMVSQLRIVASYFQMDTLNMGFTFVPVLNTYKNYLSDTGKAQFELLTQVKDQLAGCPYAGCVDKIPDDQKIATYQIPLCLAITYQGKRAKELNTDKTWDHYNSDGLMKKLADPTDEGLIKSIVKMIPTTDVTMMSDMLMAAPPNQWDLLLQGLLPDVKEAIYYYSKQAHPTSEWYIRQHKIRVSKKAEVWRKKFVDLIDRQLREVERKEMDIANAMPDGPAKVARLTAIRTWHATLTTALGEVETLEERLGLATDDDDEEARQEMVAKYQQIWDRIKAGPPAAP